MTDLKFAIADEPHGRIGRSRRLPATAGAAGGSPAGSPHEPTGGSRTALARFLRHLAHPLA